MQSVYRFQALGVNRRLSVVKGKNIFLKKFCVKKVLAKKRKKKKKRSPKPGLVAVESNPFRDAFNHNYRTQLFKCKLCFLQDKKKKRLSSFPRQLGSLFGANVDGSRQRCTNLTHANFTTPQINLVEVKVNDWESLPKAETPSQGDINPEEHLHREICRLTTDRQRERQPASGRVVLYHPLCL